MWKTIVLCGSLFASAALGLAMAARWLEPSALPAAAAIGVSLIGVVLILMSPPRVAAAEEVAALPALTRPSPRFEPIHHDTQPVPTLQATGSHPTLH
jgi:hypothetical protein